jgi:glycosyltransferase involved in cell wall biosynthesis
VSISILITTYGEPVWEEMALERAYPSALAQDPDEVILHHERHLAIGPARNKAAERASSEWLLFLDADDELHSDYLHAMRTAISGNGDPLALYQPAVEYRRKGRTSPVFLAPIGDLRHDNFLVIGTVVRRELFMQVGGFEDYLHGFEDWSLWAKCWKAGANIVQVPGAIYIAHVNPRAKHKTLWRDRKTQVATHLRVQAELFPGGVERWAR